MRGYADHLDHDALRTRGRTPESHPMLVGGFAAGSPVATLLHLQRTAGNAAVNRLLRQYTGQGLAAGRSTPTAGLMLQRCGATSCNCTEEEKAIHQDEGQSRSEAAGVADVSGERLLSTSLAGGLVPVARQEDDTPQEDDDPATSPVSNVAAPDATSQSGQDAPLENESGANSKDNPQEQAGTGDAPNIKDACAAAKQDCLSRLECAPGSKPTLNKDCTCVRSDDGFNCVHQCGCKEPKPAIV